MNNFNLNDEASLTLAMIVLHLGMWRSAAFSLKLRPQWGQGTSEGSGPDEGIGGKSLKSLISREVCVKCVYKQRFQAQALTCPRLALF